MDAGDDAILNAFLTIGGVALTASDSGALYLKPQGFGGERGEAT